MHSRATRVSAFSCDMTKAPPWTRPTKSSVQRGFIHYGGHRVAERVLGRVRAQPDLDVHRLLRSTLPKRDAKQDRRCHGPERRVRRVGSCQQQRWRTTLPRPRWRSASTCHCPAKCHAQRCSQVPDPPPPKRRSMVHDIDLPSSLNKMALGANQPSQGRGGVLDVFVL